MDDLISRQQAIDALIRIPGIGNMALDKIRELPSAQPEELDTLIKALETEHKKLLEMQKVQPHTYRGVTLNDVMMYFDSLEGNEDAWTEFCSCFECRGWGLHRIQDGDARQDFMDIVYSELESDTDNNRANRIICAADGYAERRVDDALQVIEELQSAQLGTNLAEVGTDLISRQAAIEARCNK